jgi:hypothetical protein
MSLTFADFEFYAQDRSEKALPGALNKKITMRKIRIAVSWIEECANMLEHGHLQLEVELYP